MREFLENSKGAREFLQEKIYGNMATVYHRTKISDLINKVYTSGFKPGDGAMYGRGFYSTYELESQLKSGMSETYGPIIVKFAVPISTFFIFEYEEFKKSPTFNKLGKPSQSEFLIAQFEHFKMDYSGLDMEVLTNFEPFYTSDFALRCYKTVKNFNKLCEGIIYEGRNDGYCLVAYNSSLILPMSYSVDDGKTWEEVELNKEYLRKVSKVKNRFIPDLTIKPEDFGIYNYEFDSEGFLNVFESVDLTGKRLNLLPFNFGKVDGSFSCSYNNLSSLKGSPRFVKGSFSCFSNELKSLEGCPKEVGGLFVCSKNNLKNLEGSPKRVEGSFECEESSLISLKGGPSFVGKDYMVGANRLKSLEGSPKTINGDFSCYASDLENLKGGPEKVKGSFWCFDNKLKTLEGSPKEVGGDYWAYNNATKFTEEEVRAVCKVGKAIEV